jgi:hypothetical protein
MGLFFRKKKISKDLIDEDLKIIKQNCQIIDVLMVHGDACEPLCEKLKDLREKIEFLNPSTNPDVKNADKKIGDKLGDIKIALSKCSAKGDFEGWEKLVREIEVAIAERNTKL